MHILRLKQRKSAGGGTSKRKICYRCRERNSYMIRARAVVPESLKRIQKKVRSCTRIFVAPPEFLSEVPYGVALIELSSGMRLMGRVEGEARIGADVKFCGVKESASGEYPVFEVKS